MWNRFTEKARKVVFYAQEEAKRIGENYVSTEHLLLGLVREKDSVAVRILLRMGVDPVRVRTEVHRYLRKGPGLQGQEMQLTPRGKRVIDLAYREARGLNNNYIGTEHLLLGLIAESEGVAGRALASLGIDLTRTRAEALALLNTPAAWPPAPVPGSGKPTDNWSWAWAQFTDRAQAVSLNASDEAQRLGQPSVDTEHLLLGILRDNGNAACVLLGALGSTPADVRGAVERRIAQGPGAAAGVLPLTQAAAAVIDFAFEEAALLSRKFVGPEHLLLGLIREHAGVAAQALTACGIDLGRARAAAGQSSPA